LNRPAAGRWRKRAGLLTRLELARGLGYRRWAALLDLCLQGLEAVLLDRGGRVGQLVELLEIVEVLAHRLLRGGLQRGLVEERAGLLGDLGEVAAR
jgi:hypothetical protein